MRIIAATKNNGKIKEIKQILSGYSVLSLLDIKFDDNIIENGNSFYENALIKAVSIYDHYHNTMPDIYILSDDSGLEIDALEGRPGIFSARYAGENSTQEKLIEKVLFELKNTPFEKRTARFVCSMVLLTPDRSVHKAEGFCEGIIDTVPKGNNGFGYDPIFLIKEFGCEKTMAEITDEEKNKLSHRRMALNGILNILKKIKNEGKDESK